MLRAGHEIEGQSCQALGSIAPPKGARMLRSR
jgi:hypothetical protein